MFLDTLWPYLSTAMEHNYPEVVHALTILRNTEKLALRKVGKSITLRTHITFDKELIGKLKMHEASI
jgi:hypothetical protein